MNIGKSYLTIVDIDEAVNFQATTLESVDLAKKDAATTEQTVNEDDLEASEGETVDIDTGA